MALVDANYNFIYVNVGVQGRISDGGVFKNCSLYKALKEQRLNIPEPRPLPGRTANSPFVIVADDAFALDNMLMKPYPGTHIRGSSERIYNYRLSRARVTVENAFGIISAVFRVLLKPIHLCPKKAESVILACVHLHNYLRVNSEQTYTPQGSFDEENVNCGVVNPGSWRFNSLHLTPLQRVARRASFSSRQVRDEFAAYFLTDLGKVSWQNQYA